MYSQNKMKKETIALKITETTAIGLIVIGIINANTQRFNLALIFGWALLLMGVLVWFYKEEIAGVDIAK